MSYLKKRRPRNPFKKASRLEPVMERNVEWTNCVATEYLDEDVPHPFVDLGGAPIMYVSSKTGEQVLDLITDKARGLFVTEALGEVVLHIFKGPRPTVRHVACYRDGDVKNTAVENLYWGFPMDSRSGRSLKLDQDSE